MYCITMATKRRKKENAYLLFLLAALIQCAAPLTEEHAERQEGTPGQLHLKNEYFMRLAHFMMGTVIGNPSQCYQYGTKCAGSVPCCQYFGRRKATCIDGRCLQAQCCLERQHCGIFFGDCCFHLGLQCQGNGFRGKCRPALNWNVK